MRTPRLASFAIVSIAILTAAPPAAADHNEIPGFCVGSYCEGATVCVEGATCLGFVLDCGEVCPTLWEILPDVSCNVNVCDTSVGACFEELCPYDLCVDGGPDSRDSCFRCDSCGNLPGGDDVLELARDVLNEFACPTTNPNCHGDPVTLQCGQSLGDGVSFGCRVETRELRGVSYAVTFSCHVDEYRNSYCTIPRSA